MSNRAERRRQDRAPSGLGLLQILLALTPAIVIAALVFSYFVGLAVGSPSEQVCPNKGMSDLSTWPVSKLDADTVEFLTVCGYGNPAPISAVPNPDPLPLATFPADAAPAPAATP